MIIQTLMLIAQTAQHDQRFHKILNKTNLISELLWFWSVVLSHAVTGSVSNSTVTSNTREKKKKEKNCSKGGGFCRFFSKNPAIAVKFPSLVPSLLKKKISIIPYSDKGMKFWMCPRVLITLGNFLTKMKACS